MTAGASTGDFTATLTGLTPGATYYYQAYATVVGTGDKSGAITTFTGDIASFTTLSGGYVVSGYLEEPSKPEGQNYVYHTFGEGKSRNYGYRFDKTVYTSSWVAYPLTASHIVGAANSSSWKFDPNVDSKYQINITGSSYGTNYGNGIYSRGHQCPDASRKCDATMNAQTYYATNQTPQIQQGFNGGIWSTMEGDVRDLTSTTDTVYVVTGPCYQTVGGNETVEYLTASKSGITPERVPIPNYYWKAMLKVRRDVAGKITAAAAIAVWLPHTTYAVSKDYQKHIVSVDEIEAKTGLDLFVNLPDNLGTSAESVTMTWDEFYSWK